jgi:hypothetical protein
MEEVGKYGRLTGDAQAEIRSLVRSQKTGQDGADEPCLSGEGDVGVRGCSAADLERAGSHYGADGFTASHDPDHDVGLGAAARRQF